MLFDSDAPVADFGKLQLCESVRSVLMHQDYEIDLGTAPSMSALSSWIVETADWDLGLDLFRHFGNAAPECPNFTGIASSPSSLRASRPVFAHAWLQQKRASLIELH